MNRKRMIYIGAALVVVAVWFFWLYMPAIQQQKLLKSKITETRTQLDDFTLTLNQMPLFIKTRADMQVKLKEAKSRLYAKSDLLKLFDELSRTTANHGLKLVEITPPINELLDLNRTMPGSDEPQFLSLTLTLQGSYLDFGRFVEDIEQASYFRTVNSCSITSAQDGSDKVTYSLGFRTLLSGIPEES